MSVLIGDDYFSKQVSGAETLAKVLLPNYGPHGSSTICDQKYDLPLVANTGRKILKEFTLNDPAENAAAMILKDAAMKVGNENGDGSITTVVLNNAILNGGVKRMAAGINPMPMSRGISNACDVAVASLKSGVVTCTDDMLKSYAVTTAKNKEIGETVYKAVMAVGCDGIITVEDSQGRETLLNIYDGVRYDYGMVNVSTALDREKKITSLDNPYVMILNFKVKTLESIRKVLEMTIQNRASLLLIVQEMDDNLIGILANNIQAGNIRLAIGTAPGHGDTRRRQMLALAAKTGAIMFEENNGLDVSQCGLECCGRIDYCELTKDNTLLRGFPMEKVEEVAILKSQVAETLETTKEDYEIEKLQLTQAILNGKTAQIIAGAVIEYEMFERKYLAENAVAAVKAAGKHGVLPGGGIAYVKAALDVKKYAATLTGEEKEGALLLAEALTAPVRLLADNAGSNGGKVLNSVLESDCKLCYDCETDTMCDPFANNIFDSADTLIAALKIAVSTATSMLKAGAYVAKESKA